MPDDSLGDRYPSVAIFGRPTAQATHYADESAVEPASAEDYSVRKRLVYLPETLLDQLDRQHEQDTEREMPEPFKEEHLDGYGLEELFPGYTTRYFQED